MTRCTAHIEPIAGVIRIFPPGSDYGDPYDFAATLRWIDRHTVEVLGIEHTPTPEQWRAMAVALHDHGARTVVIKRMRSGETRELRYDLARSHAVREQQEDTAR